MAKSPKAPAKKPSILREMPPLQVDKAALLQWGGLWHGIEGSANKDGTILSRPDLKRSALPFAIGLLASGCSRRPTIARIGIEAAGVDFIPENGGGAGVRLRKGST